MRHYVRQALEKFIAATEFPDVILGAAVADPNDGYSVQLFRDGSYLIVLNRHIDDTYKDTRFLRVPALDSRKLAFIEEAEERGADPWEVVRVCYAAEVAADLRRQLTDQAS